MIEKKNLQTIQLIQGDTLFVYFTFESNSRVINRVIFTCKELNLNIDCQSCSEDSSGEGSIPIGIARGLLDYNETNNFRIGEFTYDLTVLTNDGVTTYIHNGRFIVRPSVPGRKQYKDYGDNYPHNPTKEHD